MQNHNFDVDFVIPSTKQKIVINNEYIQLNQTRIACQDIEGVKYGVSLIGTAKKPLKKIYTIEAKGKNQQQINISFESTKVSDLLEEDHTYYYLMSGIWQHVKKQLVGNFIECLNTDEGFTVGQSKFSRQGVQVKYKTWFWGKTKTDTLAWSQMRYFLDKGILHIQDRYNKKKKLAFSLHHDWNAVVLNTLLHFLAQDGRMARLEKGEKI